MEKQVLKTVRPYEGLVLEIVDNGKEYKIVVNGKTEATEFCVERAYETFQQILDSFIH